MRFRLIALTALLLVMSASLAMAKDKKQHKHMDHDAMMQMYKELGTPSEPHKRFATLEGTWVTTSKEWMEPGKPAMESAGTADFKMLLDGRFLQQQYNGSMMGQPYSGIGVTAYDNLRKKYVSTWMDSMSTGIFTMEGTGSADGKTITLKGQHAEPGGGMMNHRAIWRLVDANTQTFEMYGASKGKKEMKMMEITYTRKQ